MAQGRQHGGSGDGWDDGSSSEPGQDESPWSASPASAGWGTADPQGGSWGSPAQHVNPWYPPAQAPPQDSTPQPQPWGAGGFGPGYPPSAWDSPGWGPPPPPPRRPRQRRRWLAPIAAILLGLLLVGRLLGGPTGSDDSPASPNDTTASPDDKGQDAPSTAGSPDGTYEFLSTLPDGSPVAFSSCRPIHYVVRADNAPPDADRLLDEAFAAASDATDLTFVYDGPTDEAPDEDRDAELPDRYGPGPAPVLVAWATPSEVPDLAGDVAGVAGPTTVVVDGEDPLHVSGGVYLDAEGIADAARFEGTAVARAIVMHELGHLVGLDHVDRKDQLMFPETTEGITTYQGGDLAGLALLGQGPCVSD